jgi:general secretion pathway protein E
LQPLDDVSTLLHTPVEAVLSTEGEILSALNRLYDSGSQTAAQVIEDLDAEELGVLAHDLERTQDILDQDSEAPIIRLVNSILSQAVRDRASDIHLEPFERSLKVRYRIDGVLNEVLSPPKRLQSAITSRLKIMADLNIAEKRLPQDGRITIRARNREVDIRVSVVPTAFGERLVLRLLDKSGMLLDLEDIGFRAISSRSITALPTARMALFWSRARPVVANDQLYGTLRASTHPKSISSRWKTH